MTAYPAGITGADHIAHDMRMGRFPQRSSLSTFLAERADDGAEATFACAMSGDRETVSVCPVGQWGVRFKYGPDASVIIREDDLIRLRSILDGQISNWEAFKAQGGAA